MIRAVKLVLPLLLVAAPVTAQEPAPPTESGSVARQTAHRESPLLDFEYSWPDAIEPETQLVEQLKADLAKSYDEALGYARENKADMDKANASFNQNNFVRTWTIAGETPRLLSLVENTDTYTGGAHPNHNSSALLWDRASKQKIDLAQLFTSAQGLEGTIRAEFCKLLDAERAKRREGETLEGDFAQCPSFSELTIFPARENGSGPFNSVRLIADPYVAGPYAEGDYEVEVAVSAALVEALKPEFRADFEVQRAQ
jgi:hypothetical protein